jgi:hypothetical protein
MGPDSFNALLNDQGSVFFFFFFFLVVHYAGATNNRLARLFVKCEMLIP